MIEERKVNINKTSDTPLQIAMLRKTFVRSYILTISSIIIVLNKKHAYSKPE